MHIFLYIWRSSYLRVCECVLSAYSCTEGIVYNCQFSRAADSTPTPSLYRSQTIYLYVYTLLSNKNWCLFSTRFCSQKQRNTFISRKSNGPTIDRTHSNLNPTEIPAVLYAHYQVNHFLCLIRNTYM